MPREQEQNLEQQFSDAVEYFAYQTKYDDMQVRAAYGGGAESNLIALKKDHEKQEKHRGYCFNFSLLAVGATSLLVTRDFRENAAAKQTYTQTPELYNHEMPTLQIGADTWLCGGLFALAAAGFLRKVYTRSNVWTKAYNTVREHVEHAPKAS